MRLTPFGIKTVTFDNQEEISFIYQLIRTDNEVRGGGVPPNLADLFSTLKSYLEPEITALIVPSGISLLTLNTQDRIMYIYELLQVAYSTSSEAMSNAEKAIYLQMKEILDQD